MGLAGSGPRSGAGTDQGSRQLGPASTARATRRSTTRRASGPWPPASWKPIGASAGAVMVASGMRPRVGFSALAPQHWAGWRSDPSPSLPSPNGLIPVAGPAADRARPRSLEALDHGGVQRRIGPHQRLGFLGGGRPDQVDVA